ncbi:MAG: hypothetical protein NTV49_07300 [Kiritimatiellaeota bacterium]|nr:hypothetical protein [Kiritimatiellota bacterium]
MKPTLVNYALLGWMCCATAQAMDYSAVFTAPPGGVPTGTMPDGPLLGNGDVGVVLAGPPEEQRFYIGKNDFWRRNNASVITVGLVTLVLPQLQGASYRQEQDLALAEVRGFFTKGEVAVQTRSFVDANSNLLVTELKSTGTEPLQVSLGKSIVKTDLRTAAESTVTDNDNKVNIGREQYQYLGNRWYFNGGIADTRVVGKALSAQEIADLAKAGVKETDAKVYDGSTAFTALDVPKMDTAVSVSAWIKIESYADTANYIVSKGEWNQAYSLGLSSGCLRWAINGFFLQSDKPLELKKWLHVAGTFSNGDMDLYLDGQLVKQSQRVAPGKQAAGSPGEILCQTRKADELAGKSRAVAVATRLLGGTSAVNAAGALSVTLKTGEVAYVVSAILSDLDDPDFLGAAQKRVLALSAKDLPALSVRHRDWWKSFWARSFIEIPDKEIEKRWYAALYVLGSCSRPGKVAPGLWGNWVTTDGPSWHGDFHLNYNFQAPYYMAYSGNHTDLTAPFYQAISEALPLGREMARRRGWKGVHFPVCIGPWGLLPEGPDQDHGQRSNASYVSLNYIWQYQYTQDLEFLKKTAYPYLLEVAEFWEDYLKLEPIDAASSSAKATADKQGPNGKMRYVIHRDAIHEGSGDNTNPILSLGVVRNLFRNLIVMSKDLGVDEARRAKWQDILDKLSAFPLQERNGKTVFRYTEKGLDWWNDNTLGVQHIFPCDTIGLDSDPKLLKICHDTINAMARWADYNGFATWYTVCARVGYDPKIILTKLREECDKHSLPNLLLYYGGGGIESCGGFLAINEMLLQSHEGVIRFFPCWPKDQDARFGTLRAVGAFLVSAELKGGVVTGVKIVSEKGRPCIVQNPWPGKTVRVTRNGRAKETVAGGRWSLQTMPGEVIVLAPAKL